MAPCPSETPSSRMTGSPGSTCRQHWSWMLHSGPTVISSSSARSIDPYQTLTDLPSVTRPPATTTGPPAGLFVWRRRPVPDIMVERGADHGGGRATEARHRKKAKRDNRSFRLRECPVRDESHVNSHR